MLTLADIQTQQFQQASGFCPTSDNFLELINYVIDELMIRGDWDGTLVPIQVCVKNGCATWPNYVDQVRAINSCTQSVPVRNQWFQFMEHGHSTGAESFYNSWAWRGGCINSQALMQFRAPTYNDPYGQNCYLRIYPLAPEDADATVQVFGLDANGQPLMTHNDDGTWTDGITITVALPYGSSAVTVSKIDRVVKQVTQNRLRLYAYDSVNDWLYDLATYDAWETNPSYLRYQIYTGAWNYGSCSTCQTAIVALVKLKQIPVRVSTDLILIDNVRALLNGIRAAKSEAAGAIDQSQGQWQCAIESLNRSLENSNPDQQFSAKNNVYGGRTFANRMF